MAKENFKISERPIKGEISTTNNVDIDQVGSDVFLKLIDEIFENEAVRALRWRQYTPYFNDGEPCVFSWYLDGYALIDNFDDFGYGEYEAPEGDYKNYSESDDCFYSTWSSNKKYAGDIPQEIIDKISEIEHGKFEKVLLANFGDHATVTATREGFSIDYYDHD